jgi:hypothetical protein
LALLKTLRPLSGDSEFLFPSTGSPRRPIHSQAHGASDDLRASRAGFWHMGRFAQYYRETFGELPSETCGQPKVQTKALAHDYERMRHHS